LIEMCILNNLVAHIGMTTIKIKYYKRIHWWNLIYGCKFIHCRKFAPSLGLSEFPVEHQSFLSQLTISNSLHMSKNPHFQ